MINGEIIRTKSPAGSPPGCEVTGEPMKEREPPRPLRQLAPLP